MPKGLIRSAPIEKAGPDKDAAVTPRADAGPRLPSRMKERVDTIQKTFGAKAEADAAKADLEARGYEVVIREYCEPAIDPDNYYAELTAQKKMARRRRRGGGAPGGRRGENRARPAVFGFQDRARRLHRHLRHSLPRPLRPAPP